MAVCDIQLLEAGEEVSILVEIDGTNSNEASLENNNELEIIVVVEGIGPGAENNEGGSPIVIISVMAILASLAAYQIGPRPVKKDFKRRK